MYKLLLSVAVFLWAGQVFGQLKTIGIESNGLERKFLVNAPKNSSATKELPVVFILHGGGGTAKGIVKLTRGRFNQLARRDEFIAVYPNGYKKGWNDGARDTIAAARKLGIDDVQFFTDMIAFLKQEYSISEENIFVCGISNGGFMAQKLAYELPDKINGIGVVAANLSVVQAEKPKPEKPVSVLFMCGTADPLVPYNGGQVTVFKQKRGEVFSVPESVNHWKRINGCSIKTDFLRFENKTKTDQSVASKTTWQNPLKTKIKVVDVKIENGGHTWPGTKQYLPKRWIGTTNFDFNGCDEIWDFFKSLIQE